MNPVSATQWIRARRWLSYPIAIALALLALWARLQLGGLFDQAPFLLFMLAVALSAFLGGVGPGLVAAILSGLLADYYLLQPIGSFALLWPQGWVAMGIYAAVSGVEKWGQYIFFGADAGRLGQSRKIYTVPIFQTVEGPG